MIFIAPSHLTKKYLLKYTKRQLKMIPIEVFKIGSVIFRDNPLNIFIKGHSVSFFRHILVKTDIISVN